MAPRYGKAFGQESHQHFVGVAFDRRGRHAHLEGVAMESIGRRGFRPRLGVQAQQPRPVRGKLEPGSQGNSAAYFATAARYALGAAGVSPMRAQLRVSIAWWMMRL